MTSRVRERMREINTLDDLKHRLREFARVRDWEQFHTPKNLSSALIVEAAELVEHFQWLTAEESDRLSPGQKREVALEMADILIYLIRLADRLDVDLAGAAWKKVEINGKKYPADKVHGKAGNRSSR